MEEATIRHVAAIAALTGDRPKLGVGMVLGIHATPSLLETVIQSFQSGTTGGYLQWYLSNLKWMTAALCLGITNLLLTNGEMYLDEAPQRFGASPCSVPARRHPSRGLKYLTE